MIDFVAFDCAMADWVRDCLCLDSENIRWKNQNKAQAPYPYITLLKNDVVTIGNDEDRREIVDGELIEYSYGVRELTLEIEAFADDDNGGKTSDCNAFALLNKLVANVNKSKAKDFFCDANAVFIETQTSVLDISSAMNGQFVSRAITTLRFRTVCRIQDEEQSGHIETIVVKSECVNPDVLTIPSFTLTKEI